MIVGCKETVFRELAVYIDVYMNELRDKSENPVTMKAESPWIVAIGGYKWVQSERYALSEPVLLPVNSNAKGRRYHPAPHDPLNDVRRDPLLGFVKLEPNQNEILAFANRFGLLGLACPHRHISGTIVRGAESLGQWVREIQEVKQVWYCWQKIKDDCSDRELRDFANAHEWLIRGDVRTSMKGFSAEIVNQHIGPGLTSSPDKCSVSGCTIVDKPRLARTTVRTALVLSNTRGREQIQQRMYPGLGLAAFIWRELAEMLCERTAFQQCAECGEWMDITDCARRGSKRLHDRCSSTARQRKYRNKLKFAD